MTLIDKAGPAVRGLVSFSPSSGTAWAASWDQGPSWGPATAQPCPGCEGAGGSAASLMELIREGLDDNVLKLKYFSRPSPRFIKRELSVFFW